MPSNTQYTRSWFDRTSYLVQEALDEYMANDPVAQLFTDRSGQGGKQDTFDLTGRVNDGFASLTVEGQKANSTTPIEEDQTHKNFVSVKERQIFTWESFLHDKYNYVYDTGSELAKKVMNTFHLALTHQLFNYADATSVSLPGGITYDLTTPDAAALISASHTTPAGGSSITNIGGTGALSEENLTTNILVGQENMVTSSGTSIGYNPDMLIVGNVEPMVKKAMQITGSDQVESTANNAINIYGGGRMKVMVLNFAPLLTTGGRDTTTKKYRWATADSSMLKKVLHYKWAAKPEAYPRYMDEENGDSAYLVMGRFAFGASRWQGIVMNTSTTAPTDSSGV
jgi:hypothetical protein